MATGAAMRIPITFWDTATLLSLPASYGTYRNPVLAGDYADPSVLRVGDDYYMTHSSFTFAPGLLIWHSKDLVNWRPVGKALDRYIGDVWAPDFIAHEGMFYIYVPVDGKIVALTAPALGRGGHLGTHVLCT